jgi:hypothetical protein
VDFCVELSFCPLGTVNGWVIEIEVNGAATGLLFMVEFWFLDDENK